MIFSCMKFTCNSYQYQKLMTVSYCISPVGFADFVQKPIGNWIWGSFLLKPLPQTSSNSRSLTQFCKQNMFTCNVVMDINSIICMYAAMPQELAVKNKPSHFTSSYYTSPRVYAHITHHQRCIDRQRVPACVAQRDVDIDSTKNHYGSESIMIFTIQAVTYVVVKKYPPGHGACNDGHQG